MNRSVSTRTFLPRRLTPRLLMLALIPAIAAGILSVGGGFWAVHEASQQQASSALDRADGRVNDALGNLGRRMDAYAVLLSGRTDLMTSVAAKDGAALRPALAQALAVLQKSDPSVSVMEITDDAGRILARGHNPSQSGDDKSKVPDVASALTGKPSIGAEVSPTSGALALGAVQPLYNQGRIIGTIKIAARLTAATASELSRAVGGSALLFGGERLLASTINGITDTSQLPAAFVEAVKSGRDHDGTLVAPDGQVWLLSTQPIKDIGGRPVGAIGASLSMQPYLSSERSTIIMIASSAGLALLLALPLAFVSARGLARPLVTVVQAMRQLHGGDTTVNLQMTRSVSEVADMAAAVHAFRDGMIERARLEQAAEAERAAKEARARNVESLVSAFDADASSALRAVAAAAIELDTTASGMAVTSADGARQAASVAAASEQASTNVQTVAASAEELAASIHEIAQRVSESAVAAKRASQAAQVSDAAVRGLSDSADRVSGVVEMIAHVAAQTNLLALNATIEAARAGDAGKGFAVVAAEVKQLAQQTGRATEEVGDHIRGMRDAINHAIELIHVIPGTVDDVNTLASQVAAAAEEQAAATKEIGQAVAQAAAGTRDAAVHANGLAEGSEATRAAAADVKSASGELARQSDRLSGRLSEFLSALKVA